ncbi:hypothetical protein [Natronomonas gomsonensis]|uniref:hypothetical protein n=1 Tax=Natronomonas gomsonensis TaxID=1046043 RepID=UPI0015BBD1BC|nr:hypothetical protein [Natronomonas gomsonensis]
MVDTALLWIGLTASLGVGSLGYFVRTYKKSSELEYRALAVALLCGSGVIELSMANGNIPATRLLSLVSGLSSVVAIGVVVVAIWTRGTHPTVPNNDT